MHNHWQKLLRRRRCTFFGKAVSASSATILRLNTEHASTAIMPFLLPLLPSLLLVLQLLLLRLLQSLIIMPTFIISMIARAPRRTVIMSCSYHHFQMQLR